MDIALRAPEYAHFSDAHNVELIVLMKRESGNMREKLSLSELSVNAGFWNKVLEIIMHLSEICFI